MKAVSSIGFLAGGFDMFNVEHLDLLQQARDNCDYLFAGVYTDEVIVRRGGALPVIPFAERLDIVRAMRPVEAAIGLEDDDPAHAWAVLRFGTLFTAFDPTVAEVRSFDQRLLDAEVDVVRLQVGQRSLSALPNLGSA
jgi:glycerol-3-phosphate cytidylyltransferase